jgi:hypothetical protein
MLHLGRSLKNYYSGISKIIGNVVTRTIGVHEFIPLNAIAQAGSVSDYRQLPLGIAKSDLPVDLWAGDRVDLYMLPRDSGKAPELVASNIRIQSVDNKVSRFRWLSDCALPLTRARDYADHGIAHHRKNCGGSKCALRFHRLR